MGADMLVMSWWTPVGFMPRRTDDMIRQAVHDLLEPGRLRPERFEVNDATVEFLEQVEDNGTHADWGAFVEAVEAALAALWRGFFESIDTRDVAWNTYHTGEVSVRQVITGGKSWGDSPTDTWDDWETLWQVSDDLTPGIFERLGVYHSPFEAAAAAAV